MALDVGALLAGLDSSQRRAVTTPGQPLCILAGAGSGKTRVLTRRIAHRAATGSVDARHVLALTFTRRAASELAGRLDALGLRDRPTTGTFHAVAWTQLNTWWRGEGRTPPQLLDRKAQLTAKVLGRSSGMTPGELAVEIEWARARLVPPERYALAAAQEDRRIGLPHDRVAQLYDEYEQLKRRRGVVDFDDLLERCAAALDADTDFAAAQRWRFRHLFVDEYQDVNPLQHRLLRAWLGDRDDLCVVGDPNQAIYRWNGADARFLVRFAELHPGAEVVELVDSYRSTPEILATAAAVLHAGRGRAAPLRAHRPSGAVPEVVRYPTDDDEARGIARAVRDHHRPGGRWGRQAVLVRTNGQTALVEQALRRARIPYRVRGATPFLARSEVVEGLRSLGPPGAPARLPVSDLAARVEADRPPDEATALTPAEEERLEGLESLVRLAEEFLEVEPGGTVQELRWWLAANLQGYDVRDRDAVEIVTFHAAKGLEWPVVHLAGLEDGLVPISHARTPAARAEERRLLYVGITRAQEELRMTWAEQRTFGERVVARRPSPFLADLAGGARPADAGAAEVVHDRGVAAARARLELVHEPGDHAELLHALHRWRARLARAGGVPEGVVLGDEVLSEIAERRPATVEELTVVPGVGPVKADEYGREVLELVASAGRALEPAEGGRTGPRGLPR